MCLHRHSASYLGKVDGGPTGVTASICSPRGRSADEPTTSRTTRGSFPLWSFPVANRKNTRYLAVHHTAGRVDETVDSIRRYHVHSRGWSDIGYNAVLSKSSGVWQLYMGRGLHAVGAHVKGYNSTAFGLAVCGDWRPAPAGLGPIWTADYPGWWALLNACHTLSSFFGVPTQNILTHQEFPNQATECAGFDGDLLRREVYVLNPSAGDAVRVFSGLFGRPAVR